MELRIVWTKRAKRNYLKILTYIEDSFGSVSSRKYHIRVEELITLLQSFPEIGTIQIGKDNLRGIILYRRTTIFHTFDRGVLRIINVLDNRWKK